MIGLTIAAGCILGYIAAARMTRSDKTSTRLYGMLIWHAAAGIATVHLTIATLQVATGRQFLGFEYGIHIAVVLLTICLAVQIWQSGHTQELWRQHRNEQLIHKHRLGTLDKGETDG